MASARCGLDRCGVTADVGGVAVNAMVRKLKVHKFATLERSECKVPLSSVRHTKDWAEVSCRRCLRARDPEQSERTT